MPQIYIMAVITIACAAVIWGLVLYALAGRDRRVLWLLLPGLPLSALVNLLVKAPLITAVARLGGVAPGQGMGQTPAWFVVFLWFVPPVTEELIKVAPLAPLLLVPAMRDMWHAPAGALWIGLGLGLSYGLGEAAYLAWGIARAPQYAGYPWYVFTGYAGERVTVCLVHALLTAIVAAGLQRGGWRALAGYLVAVALHALVNAGPMAVAVGWVPDPNTGNVLAALMVQLPMLAAIAIMAVVFETLRRRAMRAPGAPDTAQEVVYFRR